MDTVKTHRWIYRDIYTKVKLLRMVILLLRNKVNPLLREFWKLSITI